MHNPQEKSPGKVETGTRCSEEVAGEGRKEGVLPEIGNGTVRSGFPGFVDSAPQRQNVVWRAIFPPPRGSIRFMSRNRPGTPPVRRGDPIRSRDNGDKGRLDACHHSGLGDRSRLVTPFSPSPSSGEGCTGTSRRDPAREDLSSPCAAAGRSRKVPGNTAPVSILTYQ